MMVPGLVPVARRTHRDLRVPLRLARHRALVRQSSAAAHVGAIAGDSGAATLNLGPASRRKRLQSSRDLAQPQPADPLARPGNTSERRRLHWRIPWHHVEPSRPS